MDDGPSTLFLKAVRERLRTLTTHDGRGAPRLFGRVQIMPHLNVPMLLKQARWPAAVVFDSGDEPSPHNHSVIRRQFTVGVVDGVPRDSMGEAAALACLNRADRMVAAMKWQAENENAFQVSYIASRGIESVVADHPTALIIKGVEFAGTLDLTATPVVAGAAVGFRYQLAGAGLTPPISNGDSRALGAINSGVQFSLLMDVAEDDAELEEVSIDGDASIVSGDTPGTISEDTTRTLVLQTTAASGAATIVVSIDGTAYTFTFTWT